LAEQRDATRHDASLSAVAARGEKEPNRLRTYSFDVDSFWVEDRVQA
jgi:hypothetical protein